MIYYCLQTSERSKNHCTNINSQGDIDWQIPFCLCSVASLLTVEGKNMCIWYCSLGHAVSENRAERLMICLHTIFQLMVSSFTLHRTMKQVFLIKPEGRSGIPTPIRATQNEHNGLTLKPDRSSANAQANKIRPAVLIWEAWHVWDHFHTANACFHAHSPKEHPADADVYLTRLQPKAWC